MKKPSLLAANSGSSLQIPGFRAEQLSRTARPRKEYSWGCRTLFTKSSL